MERANFELGSDQFDIPIVLIGVGEGIDDLRDFDPEEYASALFEDAKK
jgi:fused signal recognition particle receptor